MNGNSKQRLIIITGWPCVGKTTVAEKCLNYMKTVHILMAIGHDVLIRFLLLT